jgi:hypothetical protein
MLCSVGCVAQLIGGMAQSAERAGSTTIEAKSNELVGRSFAVVVVVDRATAAEHPTLVGVLTTRISQRLAENAMASGFVPPDQVLAYLGNNPSWRAWPRGRLPVELGVDRVVLIDLIEFRMHEPGNQYLWDGLTWGSVEVYDAEAFDPDRAVFENEIRVRFPDTTGAGPGELQRELVASELLRRFVDRTSWLFYEHKEPNAIPY